MGKYLKKTGSNKKKSSDVALNFIDISPPLGVRTRAKTLASKTHNTSSSSSSSSFGYLQLRSRRLLRLKPPPPRKFAAGDDFPNSIGNPNLRANSRVRVRVDSINSNRSKNCVGNPNLSHSNTNRADSSNNSRVRVRVSVGGDSTKVGDKLASVSAVGDEFDHACCGENVMEFDDDLRERSTRESTPSNMILASDSVRTPGSTTRPASSAKATRRLPSSTPRDIPTSNEMEEFFADAEEQQQKDFIEKYNFDPVNDKPLNGRYEWKKVKPKGD
ncbi:hypothetical protein vseg_007850 [Gypsophila vaccaria]